MHCSVLCFLFAHSSQYCVSLLMLYGLTMAVFITYYRFIWIWFIPRIDLQWRTNGGLTFHQVSRNSSQQNITAIHLTLYMPCHAYVYTYMHEWMMVVMIKWHEALLVFYYPPRARPQPGLLHLSNSFVDYNSALMKFPLCPSRIYRQKAIAWHANSIPLYAQIFFLTNKSRPALSYCDDISNYNVLHGKQWFCFILLPVEKLSIKRMGGILPSRLMCPIDLCYWSK